MFSFLKKKESSNPQKIDIISKTASLLIHAAKIDENYTNDEKTIIEKTLVELGANKEKLLFFNAWSVLLYDGLFLTDHTNVHAY